MSGKLELAGGVVFVAIFLWSIWHSWIFVICGTALVFGLPTFLIFLERAKKDAYYKGVEEGLDENKEKVKEDEENDGRKTI